MINTNLKKTLEALVLSGLVGLSSGCATPEQIKINKSKPYTSIKLAEISNNEGKEYASGDTVYLGSSTEKSKKEIEKRNCTDFGGGVRFGGDMPWACVSHPECNDGTNDIVYNLQDFPSEGKRTLFVDKYGNGSLDQIKVRQKDNDPSIFGCYVKDEDISVPTEMYKGIFSNISGLYKKLSRK